MPITESTPLTLYGILIQPFIKALFGNTDVTADSHTAEKFLLYQIVCSGATHTQNILNFINGVGSLFKADGILLVDTVQFRNSFLKHETDCILRRPAAAGAVASGS